MDARGRPIGSGARSDGHRSAAAKPGRVGRARDRRLDHPSFPTRRRERAACAAGSVAGDAGSHADGADGIVPAEPDRPVRVLGLQPLRCGARSA